jgi:hypothetical protein
LSGDGLVDAADQVCSTTFTGADEEVFEGLWARSGACWHGRSGSSLGLWVGCERVPQILIMLVGDMKGIPFADGHVLEAVEQR